MQERSSLKREAAPTAHAAIEFRETPVNESGISVNLLSQIIQPAAEQCQHSRIVVPGLAFLARSPFVTPRNEMHFAVKIAKG